MFSELERKALDANPLNESFIALNYSTLCERYAERCATLNCTVTVTCPLGPYPDAHKTGLEGAKAPSGLLLLLS
jgi:hypothetical protein